ncbi:unnamed protein product [Calypogeia fissa]
MALLLDQHELSSSFEFHNNTTHFRRFCRKKPILFELSSVSKAKLPNFLQLDFCRRAVKLFRDEIIMEVLPKEMEML